jgi:putative ATP-dependent endonuclease of OLD family
MKIEKIEIENFKTLENIKISFDGYFSAISGKNNAGKTTVIKAVKSIFKGAEREFSFLDDNDELNYSRSKTQWVKNSEEIKFTHYLVVSKHEDPGLHSFIIKIAGLHELGSEFKLKVVVSLSEKGDKNTRIEINGIEIEKYETGEIFQKLYSKKLKKL